MSELVLMATLGRPQGIKGDVRAFAFADSLVLPKGPVVVYTPAKDAEAPDFIDSAELEKSASCKRMTLTLCRPHTSEKGGNVVCGFAEIKDRTAAESLYQAALYVATADLPELDEDAVYLHDMLGLSVVLHETGQVLGILDHVSFYSSQELWTIVTPDGKEILLPAVPEFVHDIDLTAEIIRITPPDGLLDLYIN